jgi:thioredoxin-dependent peroxiredoxin
MAGPGVGDPAPDFALPGSGGTTYRLGDYTGESASGVVLAFYPGDFTRVCTQQFCSYRDEAPRIEGLGVPLLGISPQSVDSHERFTQEKHLNVPLLADEDLAVADAYGVVGFAGPLGRLFGLATSGGRFVQRAVFVVDRTGVLRYRQVSRTGATYQGVDDLERAVATLED